MTFRATDQDRVELATRSAIKTVEVLRLPDAIAGIAEASATQSLSIRWNFSVARSTTAAASVPTRQVDD